jgi:hypothetical protein
VVVEKQGNCLDVKTGREMLLQLIFVMCDGDEEGEDGLKSSEPIRLDKI